MSCELGQIMTRYDFQYSWRVILRNVQTDSNRISIFVNLLDELGQIMTRYDFLEATRVILSNVRTLTPTWLNLDFGQLFIWIEANYDHIWLPRADMGDFEQCSNRHQLDLILLLVNFWYELGKIMTRYVFLDAIFPGCYMIWLAIDLLLLLVNIWFWANND